MTSPGADREAYVQFRLNNSPASAAVAGQIPQVEGQIARLQALLARQQTATVVREQGILFAWARVRAEANHELAALAEQPWFEDLTYVSGDGSTARAPAHPGGLDLPGWLIRPAQPPEGQGLCLTARLHDGGQLRLWLRPAAWPMVQIAPLPGPANGDSALFRAVLAGLVAEGRLVDLVVACAQRFGLALATGPDGSAHRPDDQAERHYFLQRGAWLTADDARVQSEAVDAEAVIRQIGDLQRRLYVLDEQRRRLRCRQDDPAQLRSYEQEYERLRSWPHVTSLAIRGDRVELNTDTIHVQGICIGSFYVCYDFAAGNVQIVNQTKPAYDGGVRFDHPHVREGSPCLGNIARPVADFMATRDLPQLIPLTLDFLLSYNPSSPYYKLSGWT
jgi:hypothetical protein